MFPSNVAVNISSRLVRRSKHYSGRNRRESHVLRRWKLFGEWRRREAKAARDRYAALERHAKCFIDFTQCCKCWRDDVYCVAVRCNHPHCMHCLVDLFKRSHEERRRYATKNLSVVCSWDGCDEMINETFAEEHGVKWEIDDVVGTNGIGRNLKFIVLFATGDLDVLTYKEGRHLDRNR